MQEDNNVPEYISNGPQKGGFSFELVKRNEFAQKNGI